MESNHGGPPPLQFDTALPQVTPTTAATTTGAACAVCHTALVTQYYDANGQSVCGACRTQLAEMAETDGRRRRAGAGSGRNGRAIGGTRRRIGGVERRRRNRNESPVDTDFPVGFSLALPVLSVVSSNAGPVDQRRYHRLGMHQAWQMTGAPAMAISGPYRLAGDSAAV